jgi:NAD(P)-dependent dehydrogenase (short-subunit alcohol dehydrogenase family)
MTEGVLEGRVAIVTGGSRGIGRATAQALTAAGARVAISGRTRADLDATAASLGQGGRLLAVQADVSVEGDVDRLVAETVSKFGGLDILVNNAATARMTEVASLSTDDWRAMIDTNISGPFFCSRAAIPHLRRRGGGWIVNISSLAAQNPFARGACYSATKAALDAFSHALMQEVRHQDIRVTTIAPGSVDTGFGGSAAGEAPWKIAPEDVAAAVLYLVTNPSRTLPSRIDMRPSKPPSK